MLKTRAGDVQIAVSELKPGDALVGSGEPSTFFPATVLWIIGNEEMYGFK